MADPITLAAIAQGAGGIFDWLGGDETRKFERWLRQYRQRLSGQLQGELGKPAITPGQINQFIPTLQKSLAPQINRIAGQASQRLGLDSPAAQGEIARGQAGGLFQQLGGFQQRATFANINKRQDIFRMLSSLGG